MYQFLKELSLDKRWNSITRTSYEHSVVGLPSEVKRNTARQKEKRANKIESALVDRPFVLHEYNDEKDILLVGVNSTYGVLNKAAKQLKRARYEN